MPEEKCPSNPKNVKPTCSLNKKRYIFYIIKTWGNKQLWAIVKNS